MAGYTWPDGSKGHSISWDVHQNNLRKQAYDKAKGNSFGSSFAPSAPGSAMAAAAAQPPQAPIVAQPQPFDPQLEAARQGAQWNTQIAGAEGAYQRGQLAYNTGFNQDGTVNASNPYSQATLLQDSYKRQQLGTNNSYASQGQLYSGARLNAQATNDRGYAQGYDALRRQTADQYHGIGFNQLQSYGSNALGVSAADYDALRRAIYG